jgi:CVNH domain-containing protein
MTTYRLISAAVLLACAAIPAEAAPPPGSYQQTCADIKAAGTTLAANCRTKAGLMKSTTLQLPCNGLIENNDGNLRCLAAASPPTPTPTPPPPQKVLPVPPGAYQGTCKEVHVVGNVLHATCQTALTLPCAGKVENVNGTLTCVGAKAPGK